MLFGTEGPLVRNCLIIVTCPKEIEMGTRARRLLDQSKTSSETCNFKV